MKSLQAGKQAEPTAWSERMNSENSTTAPVSPKVNNHIASHSARARTHILWRNESDYKKPGTPGLKMRVSFL